MAENDSAQRQVAYKVSVADVMNNKYVKEEGWLPNFIAVGEKKVSRANLLGVIVSKDSQDEGVPSQNFVLDDGSGRVSLRFFEPASPLGVGDIVTVIGRPREFGDERYIVPEIIRKVPDARWIELRRLEMDKESPVQPTETVVAQPTKTEAAAQQAETPESSSSLEVETESMDIETESPMTKMMTLIRQLDAGDGVDFADISEKFEGDCDSYIRRLLEQGDIFEVKPGRYKVLE